MKRAWAICALIGCAPLAAHAQNLELPQELQLDGLEANAAERAAWTEVETEASKQGVSQADVIWDRCGRHDEPAVPPIRAKRERPKRKRAQDQRAA